MARYADVDKLIWQVQNSDKYGTITKQVFISLLQNSETEDVAPVVHAHWVEDDDGVHCSECKKDAPLEVFTYSFHPATDSWDGDVKFNKSEFCPHCGAKMDEEVG